MSRVVQKQGEHKVLFMAIELSGKWWKLGFSAGEPRMREKNVPSGALSVLREEILRAKQRLGLSPDAKVKGAPDAPE